LSKHDSSDFLLHNAVMSGYVDRVRDVLATSIEDLNSHDRQGMTPLLWAVFGGYDDIAEELLKAGADPDLPSREGDYPLWHAEDDFGLKEVTQVLREYGASKK
jgi:ankyrin repeat protein